MGYLDARQEVIKRLLGEARASNFAIEPDYEIKLVTDQRLLSECYKLRYEVYCRSDSLLSEESYPNGMEKDSYDDHSIHFAATDPSGEVIGTTRLISYSPLGFPTDIEFELDGSMSATMRKMTVEVSRLLIRRQYRNTLLLVDLCKAAYLLARLSGNRYLLGCVERGLLRILIRLLGPIPVLAAPKFCFNAMNLPFIVDLPANETRLSEEAPRIFEYFTTTGPEMSFDSTSGPHRNQ